MRRPLVPRSRDSGWSCTAQWQQVCEGPACGLDRRVAAICAPSRDVAAEAVGRGRGGDDALPRATGATKRATVGTAVHCAHERRPVEKGARYGKRVRHDTCEKRRGAPDWLHLVSRSPLLPSSPTRRPSLCRRSECHQQLPALDQPQEQREPPSHTPAPSFQGPPPSPLLPQTLRTLSPFPRSPLPLPHKPCRLRSTARRRRRARRPPVATAVRSSLFLSVRGARASPIGYGPRVPNPWLPTAPDCCELPSADLGMPRPAQT